MVSLLSRIASANIGYIIVVFISLLYLRPVISFSPIAPSTGTFHGGGYDTQHAFTSSIMMSSSCSSSQQSSHLTTTILLMSESDESSSESSPNAENKNRDSYNNKFGNDESMRNKVLKLAKSIVVKRPPKGMIELAAKPQAIGALLKDAAEGAADEMMLGSTTATTTATTTRSATTTGADVTDARRRTEAAFATAEAAIAEARDTLDTVRSTLATAKRQALLALDEAETLQGRRTDDDADATPVAADFTSIDISEMSYDDVDYELSEMSPPFIGEDMCLVPGVPLVRVEKAPENSRRIFAGIDIMASAEDVWNVLTDYKNLQQVVPNLVVNEVQEFYPGDSDAHTGNYLLEHPDGPNGPIQCQSLTEKLKGARLRQVGGAKVVGINFSARTTLEVREWPEGMPDFAHFNDEVYLGDSRENRIRKDSSIPLQRYAFPRPFAISTLPTKDISMQSVAEDDGEFRMYQGVWRMQPLVGCAAPGSSAMRLTYAVEISPRAYLPVRLVEGRIAQDLCANLEAIRDFVTKDV